jgi:hypothetical protein
VFAVSIIRAMSTCPTGSHVANQFLARGLFIALMMETAITFETSVNVYQTTRRNNPEDIHLHTRHRENMISQSQCHICTHAQAVMPHVAPQLSALLLHILKLPSSVLDPVNGVPD